MSQSLANGPRNAAVARVFSAVFAADADGSRRARFHRRIELYLIERRTPALMARDIMTKKRHERLKRVRDALYIVVRELESDPFIFSDVPDDIDDVPLSDAWMLLQEFNTEGRLKELMPAIDAVISDNPPSGRHIQKEFRYAFWRDLAFIYEEATGRRAAVSKRDENATEGGLFVDFLLAVHNLLDRDQRKPTSSQIEHFCDWYRENRDELIVQIRRSRLLSDL